MSEWHAEGTCKQPASSDLAHRRPPRPPEQRCLPWPTTQARAPAVPPPAMPATRARWPAPQAGRQSGLHAASAVPPPQHPGRPRSRRCASCPAEAVAAPLLLPRWRRQTWACEPVRPPWPQPGPPHPSAEVTGRDGVGAWAQATPTEDTPGRHGGLGPCTAQAHLLAVILGAHEGPCRWLLTLRRSESKLDATAGVSSGRNGAAGGGLLRTLPKGELRGAGLLRWLLAEPETAPAHGLYWRGRCRLLHAKAKTGRRRRGGCLLRLPESKPAARRLLLLLCRLAEARSGCNGLLLRRRPKAKAGHRRLGWWKARLPKRWCRLLQRSGAKAKATSCWLWCRGCLAKASGRWLLWGLRLGKASGRRLLLRKRRKVGSGGRRRWGTAAAKAKARGLAKGGAAPLLARPHARSAAKPAGPAWLQKSRASRAGERGSVPHGGLR